MLEYLENIKKIREKKKYSQEYMSIVLEISQRAYSSIENGQTQLSVNRLYEISKILAVNISEILGYDSQFILVDQLDKNRASENARNNFTQDDFSDQKKLFERIIQSKDDEISFLKEMLGKG
jgi:transcriptional regulator with XRE-family HTH domain